MIFTELLAYVYKKELELVLEKEVKEPTFLTVSDFESNYDRVKLGHDMVCKQSILLAAYYTAKHRYTEHGDKNALIEAEELERSIKPEYLAIQVSDWWNN